MSGNMPKITAPRGFLSRLARDVRGNALAMMAMALIPLAGLIGGGIDISRMYITKTRLQHACDAGALAGRKAMGGGTWTQSGGMPNTTALQFFDGNFAPAAYGGRNLTRSFSENAGKVSGTASVDLQMTIVKVVTKDWNYVTLSVTCQTEMRMPNTDIMFVLDNTGSMADTPSGDTQSKMASLKVAVKCFYEIVAHLDITDQTCTAGVPSGGTSSQVQIRFGFVPYDTNVNVGKLLPSTWFANTWTYQSREQSLLYGTWTAWRNNGSGGTTPITQSAGTWSGWTDTGSRMFGSCTGSLALPADSYAITDNTAVGGTNETTTQFDAYASTSQSNYQRFYDSSSGYCKIQVRTRPIDRLATYNRAT